jgi:hypothetical protein
VLQIVIKCKQQKIHRKDLINLTDEKKKAPETPVQPNDKGDYRQSADKEEAIWDMKQELEDYIEDQGIYIRQ